MKTVSRPLFLTLILVLVLVIAAAVYLSGPFHGFEGASIMIDDHDVSDTPLGWMIAIPVLIVVALGVTAVMAGAALIASIAVAFAALVVATVMLLMCAPFVIFLALPMLAVYGFFKLIQRDRQAMAQANA